MSIYAISDPHLSLQSGKPMDVFGSNWTDHWETIKKDLAAENKKSRYCCSRRRSQLGDSLRRGACRVFPPYVRCLDTRYCLREIMITGTVLLRRLVRCCLTRPILSRTTHLQSADMFLLVRVDGNNGERKRSPLRMKRYTPERRRGFRYRFKRLLK